MYHSRIHIVQVPFFLFRLQEIGGAEQAILLRLHYSSFVVLVGAYYELWKLLLVLRLLLEAIVVVQ